MQTHSMKARARGRAATLVLAAWGVAMTLAPAVAGDERAALAGHSLTTLEGTTTTLAAFRGDVVVVNFWASWCAPCRKELPTLNAWNTAWAGRGARVVAVSIDKDVRRARRFAMDMNLSLTVLHDGPDGLARTLDIPAVPYTLLLDREGNVVGTVSGSASEEIAALGRKVETMLAARGTPPVQEAGMGEPGGKR